MTTDSWKNNRPSNQRRARPPRAQQGRTNAAPGNAHQRASTYNALARAAAAAGDPIAAENYYQHAEHYYRVGQLELAERTAGRSAE